MKLDVQVNVNKDPNANELGSGWIEVENFIKFPFRIRKYTDKKDGKVKSFVTYPQKKTKDGYSPVVNPENKEVRNEIENAVMEQWRREMEKQVQVNSPNIDKVRVSLLDQEPKGDRTVVTRGIASITVAGFVINGLMVKEGKKGLFVEMPQHFSGGDYKDTVYATTSMAQSHIREEVLFCYNQKVEELQHIPVTEQIAEQPPESPEKQQAEISPEKVQKSVKMDSTAKQKPRPQESLQAGKTDAEEALEQFLAAYAKNDTIDMSKALSRMTWKEEKLTFTKNNNDVSHHALSTEIGSYRIDYAMSSDYDSRLIQNPSNGTIHSQIHGVITKDGNPVGLFKLFETKTTSPEKAKENYQIVKECWEDLTGQKITIPREPDKNIRQSPKAAAPKV